MGQGGRDATIWPNAVAVRQNLNLLVDHGMHRAGAEHVRHLGLRPTLGGIPDVWRSGLGETADGAFVYPARALLTIVDLAELPVWAGAVRAMETDINPYWTVFASVPTSDSDGPSGSSNATDLWPGMTGTPARLGAHVGPDFMTMSAL